MTTRIITDTYCDACQAIRPDNHKWMKVEVQRDVGNPCTFDFCSLACITDYFVAIRNGRLEELNPNAPSI
jgi:hypothetical protein